MVPFWFNILNEFYYTYDLLYETTTLRTMTDYAFTSYIEDADMIFQHCNKA